MAEVVSIHRVSMGRGPAVALEQAPYIAGFGLEGDWRSGRDKERQITLIVLGLTGKNVFARLLAGNVPVELIKNTKIPVLILPPDWNKTV